MPAGFLPSTIAAMRRAPRSISHRAAVDVAAPPVPAADDGADDAVAVGGDEEARARLSAEPLEILERIGGAGEGLGAPPELQHGRGFLPAAWPDRDVRRRHRLSLDAQLWIEHVTQPVADQVDAER